MTTLRTLITAAWLLLAPLAAARGAEVTGGPMVGATTDTTATIWVRTDGPAEVQVRVGERAFTGKTRAQADHTVTIAVPGLEPDTEYAYTLQVDGAEVPAAHAQRLRTMPRPGTGKVTLAFGSCVNMSRQPDQPIFDVIAGQRPSAFVFLGDNSYFTREDCQEAASMWARVREQRQNRWLARLLAGTPVFAQWDDHDYGPNDSDHTFALKGVARDIFRAYWPMPAYGQGDEGIYSVSSLGPVDLFMCDDRWWRSPAGTPDGPEKTILGQRQRDWLLRGLIASQAPIKVVATASQFLARYHAFESWQRAREERELIVDTIRDRGVRGVVFISGDRHLAEALRWPAERAGYTLWEVTSSPLANRTFDRGGLVKNDDRAFVHATSNNFGWIEVDAARRKVTLELRGPQGETLWSVAPDDLWPPEDEEKKPGRRSF